MSEFLVDQWVDKFQLDQRLAADCHVVGELALSRVLLMDDSRYPWLILVPKRPEITEVFQLSESDQHNLWREVTSVGEMLMKLSGGDKLNIGALGNMVPQLHVHVIAREKGDAAWPGPVWGVGERQAYTDDSRDQRFLELRNSFGEFLTQ